MHGLGNDYVFVDCLEKMPEHPQRIAREISVRHYSVGADGLILICPSQVADFRMKMYNADGSVGQMCGNGIRCLGKYVYEHGRTDRKELTVETDAGIRRLVLKEENGKVESVEVDMGIPEFDPEKIPVRGVVEPLVQREISVADRIFPVTCLSMGNPHCVVFVEDTEQFEVLRYGPLLERHELFPDRINVEFVQVMAPDRIRMRVWERGSGETCACGTGACASVAAAYVNGLCTRKMTVSLKGGELQVYWSEEDSHIYMTGPAVEVYTGLYEQ